MHVTSFKPTDPKQILRGIVKASQARLPFGCRKVCYPTPAAAKKALRDYGYALGCANWYLCPHEHLEPTYHLTSRRGKRKP